MHDTFSILRQHASSIIFLIVVYYLASWLSGSQILSIAIGLCAVSPILVAILNRKTISRHNFTEAIFSLTVLKLLAIILLPITTATVVTIPIEFLNSKWMTGFTFAIAYALVFSLSASKLYSIATGEYGCRLLKSDILLVALTILSINLTEIATDYFFTTFPSWAPLYLLLNTTVFISAFILQAIIVLRRNTHN